MKIHNKYIFDNTIKTFFLILIGLISIVWFTKTISFVRYVTNNGIEASEFFYLFVLILPRLLIYMVPICLFISSIAILNKMINSNEITVLRNSGLSDIKITKPIIKISLYLSFFCLIISMFLMPYANKKLSLAKANLRNNYSNISFNEGVFENMKDITVFVASKNKKDNKLYGILLNDNRNKNVSLTITARQGSLGVKEGLLFLYMQEGTVQRYSASKGQTDILDFDSYVFNLTEQKNDIVNRVWKPKERYLHELIISSNEEGRIVYIAQMHMRVIISLCGIAMTFICAGIMMYRNFSRKGNLISISYSVISCVLFFGITISLFRLSEANPSFIYLNYVNLIFFILLPLYFLSNLRYRK